MKLKILLFVVGVAVIGGSVTVLVIQSHPRQLKFPQAPESQLPTAMSNYSTYQGRVDTIKKAAATSSLADSMQNENDTTSLNGVMKSKEQLKEDIKNLQALDLPLGWSGTEVKDVRSFLGYALQWKHMVGWLATILAICMGAPFWFDVLGKVANIRGSGPKPSSSSDADTRS